jgi:hypothetical protein
MTAKPMMAWLPPGTLSQLMYRVTAMNSAKAVHQTRNAFRQSDIENSLPRPQSLTVGSFFGSAWAFLAKGRRRPAALAGRPGCDHVVEFGAAPVGEYDDLVGSGPPRHGGIFSFNDLPNSDS